MAKGLQGKDYEAHSFGAVIMASIICWIVHKEPWPMSPHGLLRLLLPLARRWRVCSDWLWDAVAYQRTLKWLLEQEMKKRGSLL